MRALIERFLQFLLPSQCHCCERFLEEGQKGICPDCLSKIRWIEPPLCTLCGVPFLSREIENHPCGACLTRGKYFTMARAVGYYEGPLREAIHRWKYEEKSYLTLFFGEKLAEGFCRYWDPQSFDLIIPVPLTSTRLREKGVRGSFHIQRDEEIEGKSILLVDDVYTTGATVNECSKVLLKAGAERVDVLTIAHAIKIS